jgi:hypothetical protein
MELAQIAFLAAIVTMIAALAAVLLAPAILGARRTKRSM